MAESQEAASLRLYEILERVGLSEEMRFCHRQVVIGEIILTVWGNLMPGYNHEVYIFGSYSEGSTVRDTQSDIDSVYCKMNPPLVTDVKEAGVRESLLTVQDYHTYPGYVKLQRVLYGVPMTISEMDEDNSFVPDIYGRICYNYFTEPFGTVSGPAIVMILENSAKYDYVAALRCISMPERSNPWLLRRRQYVWPSRRCLDRMSHLPHFVVGVGHPYSVDRYSEWRISYSLHERELMFSLNSTQQKCYGTMKMIKKDVIEPTIGEDSISSYHLKTCLFWAIEKTTVDIWRPDQLLHCINRCFWYLLFFVLTHNCPNYFLPDANLFEREVFKRLHDGLSTVIQHIIQTSPDVVSRIKCAGVGRLFLHRTWNIHSDVLNEIGITAQRIGCNSCVYTSIQLFNKTLFHISYRQSTQEDRVAIVYHILHKLSRVQRITEHTEEQTEEARQLMLPCLHFRLATCLAGEGFNVNNGSMRQSLLQLSILHLTQSSTRDLMVARLMYVTILYKLGRYNQCETLLRQIGRDIQPYVISSCSCCTRKSTPMPNAAFMKWAAVKKLSGRSLLSAMVTCVTFLPSERELVPEPLQYELNRSRDNPHIPSTDEIGCNIYDWASVDGKVYFHLMEYLVFSQLDKPVQKQAARNNIRKLVEIDPELRHRDTAYNVLGWIYGQEGAYREARRCWRLSLTKQHFHNAASRHVQALSKQDGEGTGV